METLLALGAILGTILFFGWLMIESKKQGRTEQRERDMREALDDADLANKVARDIARRGAADRLQDDWSRE